MTRSQQLFEAAQQVMPGGVNSPVRACRSVGTYPRFLEKGLGSHVWDVDGKEYIDLTRDPAGAIKWLRENLD